MKGIILAGGSGTRLFPLTIVSSKQLLPIYDKPMIYYPLSTLMLGGIKDILVISTPQDKASFQRLLGDGSQFGISLAYAEQPTPDGLAQAFLIGEEFIENDECAMILGDNFFYGSGLTDWINKATQNAKKGYATIFGYYVDDPQRFGVMEYDSEWNIISVEEKPIMPKSNYCITGLYFYPKDVTEKAKKVQKSARGELEITSLNRLYLDEQRLKGVILGRGYAWMDTGTVDSLVEATEYVKIIEKRQGVIISAPEEIAFRKKWITKDELLLAAERYGKSAYGVHLRNVADGIIKY